MRDGGVVAQLLECGDEPRGVAGHLARGDVGEGLSLATDGGLHRLGDDRGQDEQGETHEGQRISPSVVVALAANADRRSTTSCGWPCR